MISEINVIRTLRIKWARLVQGLPDWMFAPDPAPIDRQSMDADHGKPITEEDIQQRKKNHYEISKTIGRLFYTLVGTCLFCTITLMSPPDFIKNEYAIVLPLLNYEVHFDSFLVVGPIIITGLTIYLHIFVGEYRRYKASPDVNYTMLHDFESWAPRLAVVAIFYWMVPVTLAAFTWNTTTTGRGYIEWFPILLTSAVTAGLIVLQIRRCPKKLRPRAYPWLFLVSAGFMGVLISIVSPPTSNEPQASPATDDGNEQARARTDFEEKDYSGEIFSSGHEGFKGANLPGVNFRRAKLIEADLSDANLSGANFRYADLTGASLVAAELSGADFFGAILHGVDISDVDLWGVKIDSYQLRQVCGENVESVPGNFFIKPCEP